MPVFEGGHDEADGGVAEGFFDGGGGSGVEGAEEAFGEGGVLVDLGDGGFGEGDFLPHGFGGVGFGELIEDGLDLLGGADEILLVVGVFVAGYVVAAAGVEVAIALVDIVGNVCTLGVLGVVVGHGLFLGLVGGGVDGDVDVWGLLWRAGRFGCWGWSVGAIEGEFVVV